MAEGRALQCSKCDFAIEVWSDGNPFYIHPSEGKVYCYHPETPPLPLVGNDVPYFCLDCCTEFNVEHLAVEFEGRHGILEIAGEQHEYVPDEEQSKACPKCSGERTIESWDLRFDQDGPRSCPKCGKGELESDGQMIS